MLWIFLQNRNCSIHKTNCTQRFHILDSTLYYSEVSAVKYGQQWADVQRADHISSCSSHQCTAVTLVELTVTENQRCNDRPRVDDDARPAGCNLHPHCRLIHCQVQVWLRPTYNTNINNVKVFLRLSLYYCAYC